MKILQCDVCKGISDKEYPNDWIKFPISGSTSCVNSTYIDICSNCKRILGLHKHYEDKPGVRKDWLVNVFKDLIEEQENGQEKDQG